MNTNLDFSHCIQSATNFGENVYTNICTGAVNHVPWGTMDYIGCSALIGLGIVLFAMIAGLVYAIITT